MLAPRWYQSQANAAVWEYLGSKSGNCVAVLPTGAGKSLLIALLIQQALEFGGRVVVLAHRKELLQQNADEIRGLIPGVDVGIYSAGLKSREIHNAVVVAGIQSVYRKAEDLGRRHLVIVDECFCGDTLISTPMGERRIDNMRCGDTVYCSAGVGIVSGISCKPVDEIFTVEMSNGEIARCTGDHPFFTERGWKKVREMAVGEVLFSQQAVCEMWSGVHSIQKEWIHTDGESIQTAEMLLSILCKEIEEPNEQPSGPVKSEGNNSRKNVQAYSAWRERAVTSLGSACDSSCFGRGVGGRNFDSDGTLPGRIGTSDKLQDRHSEQGEKNRDRTRRGKSLHAGKKVSRCKKNGILGDVRVVNISSEKREGSTPVFNLHVSGHPSYFANGVLVHNCHLVSELEDSMYKTFLQSMLVNQGLRIVGLSATPFRTGAGPICGPERIFQRVVFEAKTAQLIAEGFLCPITNKVADAEVNTDKVSLRGGEFVESEMQAAFDVDEKVQAACAEILEKTQDRHSILVFASGIHHAEQIAELLPGSAVVTGETLPIERAETLRRFVAGELRFLVNVDVLTTGFNAKCVDAIAILRATMSPGLFCQMVGRGLRLHPSKTNCLLLDFGGNIARHGSIDDENFGRSEGKGRAGVAALNGRGKKCPACELDVAVASTVCPECNFLFPRERELKHDTTADESSQLTGAMPPEEWDVKDVIVKVHTKKDAEDAPQTVRVDYVCHPLKSSTVENDCKYQCGATTGTTRLNGPHVELICDGCGKHQKFVLKSSVEQAGNLATITIPEWVCPGHTGFARSKFLAWWDARSICDPPENAPDAVALINMGVCRRPVRITTKKDGRWHRITECFFESEKPTELAPQEETRVYSGDLDDCPF